MEQDFLIIGGGIAGISAAAKLSHLGAVTVCESEPQLAYHASGRSAALYEPYYGPPPVVELSLASGDALRDAGVLSPRGVLMVAPPQDEAIFRADADGMHLTAISVDEAVAAFPALDPAKIAFAASAPHAQDIDTDLLVQSYARRARGRGATVLTGAPVTALRHDGRWIASTPKGEIRAKNIVNAAGAWVDVIAEMAGAQRIGITPKRRSMARIPAPEGMDPANWPSIFGAGETWYAKPDAGALIVSPADAEPTTPHDAWADDMVLAEGLARYEEVTRFPVERLLANWAGLRSFAPDGVPVIGADPDLPGFWWLAGQGGYGFQSAPGAAAFLAALMRGETPDATLARSLSPQRFR